MELYHILILIILLIGIYINQNNKENFVTFFNPNKDLKTNSEIINLNKIDSNTMPYYKKYVFDKLYNRDTLTNIYDNKKYNLVYDNNDNYWKNISNFLIKNSSLLYINLIKSNDYFGNIKKLYNEKIDFLAYPSLIINNYIDKYPELQNKISMIGNCNYQKIYMLSIKNHFEDLYNLNDIRVGFVDQIELLQLFWKQMLQIFGIIQMKQITTNNIHDTWFACIEKLKNDEIDLIVFTDQYPSIRLQSLIDNDVNEIYCLLDIPNEVHAYIDDFPALSLESVDLNEVSYRYLPIDINGIYYNQFRPNLYMFTLNTILLTYPNMNDKTIYKLTELMIQFEMNRLQYRSTIHTRLNVVNMLESIQLHNGSRKYMYDKGYFSNIDLPECKYLIGKERCTYKNLKKHKLIPS